MILTLAAAAAAAAALAAGAAPIVLLRAALERRQPQCYADGPEVPTAPRAAESLGASTRTLDEEIDQQLVGIARLVR